MSYTKTTWSDGDVITAQKLNKLENGVANAGSILIVHENDGTLDKTWQEICDSFINMIPVYLYEPYENGSDFGYALSLVNAVTFSSNYGYCVFIHEASNFTEYVTDSPSGYPMPHMQ